MELASRSLPNGGHQSKGQAWDPGRADVVELLRQASHSHISPIYYGSNHCFLVTLDGGDAGRSLAVYKPARGEYPLYDFPTGTLYRREVGSWIVSDLLGWNLVPPTVVTHGVYGVGSLQLFIESYPEGEIEIEQLQRLVLLDLILNNADRKAEHCLLGENGKLWGIDHGLTFHVQPKIRTVLWHLAGTEILAGERADLRRLQRTLKSGQDPQVRQLRELISPGEWRALSQRIDRIAAAELFPDPRYKPVPYRW